MILSTTSIDCFPALIGQSWSKEGVNDARMHGQREGKGGGWVEDLQRERNAFLNLHGDK